MARPRVLDKRIMEALVKKLSKKDTAQVYGLVNRKAKKLGISAEAALVLLARENDIGTSTYLRKLDSIKQTEVARASIVTPTVPANTVKRGNTNKKALSKTEVSDREKLKFTIDTIIQDEELRSRCRDLLLASDHFDRSINQATLVLEDRIRKKAKPTKKLVGIGLVGDAFNDDINNSILKVSTGESEDQRGIAQILRGIVLAFRNKTHHHITKGLSREDAIRVCGFIDVLLRVVDNSNK